MKTLDKSQQTDLFPTELESMSSQEDFHVRISPLQEIRLELKAKEVGYGLSAPVFLGTFSPDTPSLKTSQTCLTEEMEIGLSEFCGTFPKSGMMQSGTVYELQTLARPTGGNESGLFATPTATANQGSPSMQKRYSRPFFPTPTASLAGAEKNWKPTRPSGHRAQMTLQTFVKMYPTPTARDYKDVGNNLNIYRNKRQDSQLGIVVKRLETGGSLNPKFVEWLMGFPTDHTDLNA